jgi:ketosteroid isomerase-like protein
MSEENVEIVRRMYEAFDLGDADSALAYLDPKVIIDATHRVDGRVGQGHEEVVAILTEWLGTWDEWHEQVDEMREIGDQVLVFSTQRGRGKGSGVEVEHHFAMLYDMDGGKITRWTIYDDPAQALKAARA